MRLDGNRLDRPNPFSSTLTSFWSQWSSGPGPSKPFIQNNNSSRDDRSGSLTSQGFSAGCSVRVTGAQRCKTPQQRAFHQDSAETVCWFCLPSGSEQWEGQDEEEPAQQDRTEKRNKQNLLLEQEISSKTTKAELLNHIHHISQNPESSSVLLVSASLLRLQQPWR